LKALTICVYPPVLVVAAVELEPAELVAVVLEEAVAVDRGRGAVGSGQEVVLAAAFAEGAIDQPGDELLPVARLVEPRPGALRLAGHRHLRGLAQIAHQRPLAIDHRVVEGAEHQVEDPIGAVVAGDQEQHRPLAGMKRRGAPDLHADAVRTGTAGDADDQVAARDVPLEHPLDLDQVVGGGGVDGGAVDRQHAGLDDRRRLVGEVFVGNHH
jgi:hypothetical protein